ncbi:MAG: hypothetical protein ACI97K_001189 [Glaciecola sp.]|jgi:hypothetical protein
MMKTHMGLTQKQAEHNRYTLRFSQIERRKASVALAFFKKYSSYVDHFA